MGEQDLLRCEGARIIVGKSRPRPEERDLESHPVPVGSLEPPGDIPPLVAEFGMRPVIGGKMEHDAGTYFRKLRIPGRVRRKAELDECSGGGNDGNNANAAHQPHYQSSRTASSVSCDNAFRPAINAVPAEAAISATATAPNSVTGSRTSMVQ